MSVPTTVGMDTVRTAAQNIPANAQCVLGYDTGSGIVPWTQTEWNRFTSAIKLHITQVNGTNNVDSDIIDIEPQAATIDQAVEWCKERIAAHKIPTCYLSESNVTPLVNALVAVGINSGVYLGVAHPGMSIEDAQAILDNAGGPFPIAYVQYAWPDANLGGNLKVPGSNQTLAEANIDLNLIRNDWLELVRPSQKPDPTPVEIKEDEMYIVRFNDAPNPTDNQGIWFLSGLRYQHIPTPGIVTTLRNAGAKDITINWATHEFLLSASQSSGSGSFPTKVTLSGSLS